jgi:hypothetical protein
MSNLPGDRDWEHTKSMWETTRLVTDYQSQPQRRIIQEVMHDLAPCHDLKRQQELHERIRNDDDYDDWDYGTEPVYGIPWKSS